MGALHTIKEDTVQTVFGKSGFTFDAKDATKLSVSVCNAKLGETMTLYRTSSGMYVMWYEETPGGFADATPISAYAARFHFRHKDTTRFVSEEEAFPESLCDALEDPVWAVEEGFRNFMQSAVKCGGVTPEQADTIWIAVMGGKMGEMAEPQPVPETVKVSGQ